MKHVERRAAFWAKATAKLDALSKRVSPEERRKLEAALEVRIPKPSSEEISELSLRAAAPAGAAPRKSRRYRAKFKRFKSSWRIRCTRSRCSARAASGHVRRAAEQRYERAAPHSITSSARPSSESGTVIPSALAVFMLMIRSILVVCWTGKSPGEDCPPSAAASSMQDIRHRYCHYDDQEERHTKRHHPMPFGRHRLAKPKLVAKKVHFFPPRVFDHGWPCTTKQAELSREHAGEMGDHRVRHRVLPTCSGFAEEPRASG